MGREHSIDTLQRTSHSLVFESPLPLLARADEMIE